MSSPRPTFSIVSAVYDVQPYLDEFIESIEAQGADPGAIEIIAVDDGSADGSLGILEAWAARATIPVTVVHQENAGQAAARNAGLRIARGEWVTFTDPDDKLGVGFLDAIRRFVDANPDVEVVGTMPVLFNEQRGPIRPVHPRTAQFRPSRRIADLEREPNAFPGSATLCAFRLDSVRAQGLEFDVDLRPGFEDQHFTARFLLDLERPQAGLVRARYFYRRRLATDSTTQRIFSDPRRYTTMLERGYLDLLRRARGADGAIPEWVKQVVIYDLSALFREHDRVATRVALPDDLAPRFHELVAEILDAVEPEVVYRHTASRLSPALADTLAHGYRGARWVPERSALTRVDAVMGLQRVVYRHSGDRPVEEVISDGLPTTPAWAKTRPITYFGRTLLSERILWVPASPGLELRLDGTPVPMDLPTKPAPRPAPRPPKGLSRLERLRWRFEVRRELARLDWDRLLARKVYGRRFRDAWVLMDRIDEAGDNGERLFEYLRRERRDINAWYVLERGNPDWERLRRAGTDRLVAHGSHRWKMLMLNAKWLLSSHADKAIVRPGPILELVPRVPWRFGFLQHGITKDDLSAWLNKVEMDLFVVSTEAELASVAGDGTRYAATHRETRLTGLPRFDRLLRLGRDAVPSEVDLVLVAPTWRTWLSLPLVDGEIRRRLSGDFWTSQYVRAWLGILESPEIAEAVRARGWRLAFMPHPNVQQALPRLALPPHVEALSFSGNDVQRIFARCSLMVTDYSSVAFDAAYLERPVVYYQFDHDEVERGGHIGRRGYHDFARDGFGPVALDHDAAVAAIVSAIEHGPTPAPAYLDRIDRTFPARDGGACARVVSAVEELGRPWVPGR